MNAETLNCNNCGAPLSVPSAAKYVTCTHCGTQLAIRRTESVAYTEKLDVIAERTEQIAEQVARLAEDSELERLDRQWAAEQEQFMVHDDQGNKSLPHAALSLVAGGLVATFGLIWTIGAASVGAPGFVVAFGVVFILFALFATVAGYAKANDFQAAFRKYRRLRADFLRRKTGAPGQTEPSDPADGDLP